MDELQMEQVPVDQTKQAQKIFSKIGFIYLIGTVILYACVFLISMLLEIVNPSLMENPDLSLVLLSIVPMYLVAFPLVIFLMKKSIPANPPARQKLGAGQYILHLLMCMALAYIANFVGLILTSIIGLLRGTAVNNTILDVTSNTSNLTILIYMVLMAPIMEEFLFRKLIIDRTVKYGKSVAIFVSGLMFGLYHGNLNQFVYAFVIGSFLAYLYVKTGNIKITISIHMIFNFIGGFVASGLLKNLDLNALEENPAGAMDIISENMVGWALYFLFIIAILGIIIAGFVLFIVYLCKGSFKLQDTSAEALPKKGRLRKVIINPGMLTFVLVFVIVIILQLFGVL